MALSDIVSSYSSWRVYTLFTTTLRQMPHLAKHIGEDKTTLRQLGEEHKPLITVPYSPSYHNHAGIYDMDSDEFDSDLAYDY